MKEKIANELVSFNVIKSSSILLRKKRSNTPIWKYSKSNIFPYFLKLCTVFFEVSNKFSAQKHFQGSLQKLWYTTHHIIGNIQRDGKLNTIHRKRNLQEITLRRSLQMNSWSKETVNCNFSLTDIKITRKCTKPNYLLERVYGEVWYLKGKSHPQICAKIVVLRAVSEGLGPSRIRSGKSQPTIFPQKQSSKTKLSFC